MGECYGDALLLVDIPIVLGEKTSKALKEIIQNESLDEVKINMSSMEDIFNLQEMYKINDQEKMIENDLKKMGYVN